jgi:hypothetical protein
MRMNQKSKPVWRAGRDGVCLIVAVGTFVFLPNAYSSIPNLLGLLLAGWLGAQWLRALEAEA